MADSTVKVAFLGDTSDFKKATKDVEEATGKLSGHLSGVASVAAGIFTAQGISAGASALWDAGQAAAEDEAAQASLAKTLENVTAATKDQVAGVESFISKTQNATGVLDDELRPAFDALVRGTKDVTKAQDLMSVALDVSTGTGKPLVDVADALSKAYNGNMKSLKALDPALNGLIKDGASADEVFSALSQTFGGQMDAKTKTVSGQMQILKARMADLQEEVGAKVNVAILAMADFIQQRLIPAVQGIVGWLKEHKEITIAVGVVIAGALVAAFVSWAAAAAAAAAATIAATWPILAIGAAIAALVAGVIYAYTHWGWFRDTVDAVASFITGTLVPAFQDIWSFISDKVIPIIVDVVGKWWQVQTAVIAVGVAIAKFVADVATTLAGWVLDVWKFGGMVLEFFKSIPDKIAEYFTGLADKISKPFREAFRAVVQEFWDTIGSIPGAKQVIGGLASGGSALDKYSAGLPGTAAVVNNYTVNTSTLDPAASGDAVVAAIKAWENSNGALPWG